MADGPPSNSDDDDDWQCGDPFGTCVYGCPPRAEATMPENRNDPPSISATESSNDSVGPPIDSDRPCEHEGGCDLPGRFAIGIDQGAMRYWCVDHIEDGLVYFGRLVRGIREAIGRA